jgi:hypothetical protein
MNTNDEIARIWDLKVIAYSQLPSGYMTGMTKKSKVKHKNGKFFGSC